MKFASTIPWQIRIETARFEARQREQSMKLRYQLDRFAAQFKDVTLAFTTGTTGTPRLIPDVTR